ncbi:MAG: hypothetical protein ACPGQP_03845 [Nitrosopumilus sp.]
MTSFSEIEFLKSENKKLRDYISLILAEIELTQRTHEIKQNFPNPADSMHIVVPILDRISKIKLEKIPLEKALNLN